MNTNNQYIKAQNLVQKKHYSKALIILETLFQKEKVNINYVTAIIYCLFQLKKYKKLVFYLNHYKNINPKDTQNYFNLGFCYQTLQEYKNAEICYFKIIELDNKNIQAYLNLGSMLRNIEKLKESVEIYNLAIKNGIKSNKIYTNLSSVYIDLKDYSNASDYALKALHIMPNDYLALNNLGVINTNLKNFDAADKKLQTALKIQNKDPLLYLNLGINYKNQNNDIDALKCFNTCINLNKNFSKAYLYKSLIHLSKSNFKEGWKNYEYRWHIQNKNILSKLPLWEPNQNFKSVLIWGEQGLGEQILFSSIIKDLEKEIQKLTMVVNHKLKEIFQISFPHHEVYAFDENWDSNSYDCQIPFGSLPYHFRNSDTDFSDRKAYLYTKEKFKLHTNKKFKCGISWKSVNSIESKSKSMKLSQFIEIFQLKDHIEFFNLQYTQETNEIHELEKRYNYQLQNIDDLDAFNDLKKLSEAIVDLDFIITISNTTAHLAAALGVPTYILLSKNVGNLWYWCNNLNNKNLWYSSAQIFQQEHQDQWKEPIQKIKLLIKDRFLAHE